MLGALFFEGQGGAWLFLLIPVLGLLSLILARVSSWAFPLLAVVGLASGFFTFLSLTQNELLFTDDHPSFLFRLMQLKEFFPGIPFYNPLWNAGVEAREFFPSGILNVFFLFSPLIYSFDLATHYNQGVAILLFMVVPALSGLAALIAGYGRREISCGTPFFSRISIILWK